MCRQHPILLPTRCRTYPITRVHIPHDGNRHNRHRPYQLGMESGVYPTPWRLFYLPRVELKETHVGTWFKRCPRMFIVPNLMLNQATILTTSTRCLALVSIEYSITYVLERVPFLVQPTHSTSSQERPHFLVMANQGS